MTEHSVIIQSITDRTKAGGLLVLRLSVLFGWLRLISVHPFPNSVKNVNRYGLSGSGRRLSDCLSLCEIGAKHDRIGLLLMAFHGFDLPSALLVLVDGHGGHLTPNQGEGRQKA